MKLTTLGAMGTAFGLLMFALAVEMEMEYIDIAIGGVLALFLLLMWIVTLLMDLNRHFEKLEEKEDSDVQE